PRELEFTGFSTCENLCIRRNVGKSVVGSAHVLTVSEHFGETGGYPTPVFLFTKRLTSRFHRPSRFRFRRNPRPNRRPFAKSVAFSRVHYRSNCSTFLFEPAVNNPNIAENREIQCRFRYQPITASFLR